MNFYISVQGGLGLNISLARFIASYKHLNKNTEDKFYIKSPYWDVFEACPAVDYVYKPDYTYDFLQDAKYDENSRLVVGRIYDNEHFIKKEDNYMKAWGRLLGIKPPKIILDDFLDPIKKFPSIAEDLKKFDTEDFVIMQFWGGQSPLDSSDSLYDYEIEHLKRAYPKEYAQRLVDLYKKKYPSRKIYLYSLPNEPELEHTEKILVPYLTYYELAKKAKGFVAIDSSLQHLITGLCPGVVLWGHTHPDHFGYAENNNILQNCRRDDIYYFTELGPSNARVDYIDPDYLINLI